MKKGDKVILTSLYFGSREGNPYYKDYPNVVGVITYYGKPTSQDDFNIKVSWSNGHSNSYNAEHLSLLNTNLQKLKDNYEILQG